MKKLFDKIKLFIDAYKMWLFFCVLVGTNGITASLNSSAPIEEKKVLKPDFVVKPPTKPSKTIIIHKFDAELAKKLIKQELDKHKNGSQH